MASTKDQAGVALEYLQKKVTAPQQQQQTAAEPKNSTSGYVAPPQVAEKMIDFYTEIENKRASTTEKFKRMAKSNPLVPIGCLVTIGVLVNGLFAMKNNNTAKSQRMMRYRVVAQGATVLALVAGTMILPYFSFKASSESDDKK